SRKSVTLAFDATHAVGWAAILVAADAAVLLEEGIDVVLEADGTDARTALGPLLDPLQDDLHGGVRQRGEDVDWVDDGDAGLLGGRLAVGQRQTGGTRAGEVVVDRVGVEAPIGLESVTPAEGHAATVLGTAVGMAHDAALFREDRVDVALEVSCDRLVVAGHL